MNRCDPTGLVALDPWLAPYTEALRHRCAHYQYVRSRIEGDGGLLGPISQGYHYFRFTRGERTAGRASGTASGHRGAHSLRLIGDFNGWDHASHPLVRGEWGVWGLFLPDDTYAGTLVHGSRVKVHVVSDAGGMDRIALRPPRGPGAGRGRLRGAVLDAAEQVQVPACRARDPRRGAPHLRSARRHGTGGGQGRIVRRVHRAHPAAYPGARLQCGRSDGRAGAPLLRLVRVPRQQPFRPSSRFGTPEQA